MPQSSTQNSRLSLVTWCHTCVCQVSLICREGCRGGGGVRINILFYLLCAADTQYIVEHFPVFFSYLVGARCSKTVYMLSPFSCSGQTYIPTVKEFNSLNLKWRQFEMDPYTVIRAFSLAPQVGPYKPTPTVLDRQSPLRFFSKWSHCNWPPDHW